MTPGGGPARYSHADLFSALRQLVISLAVVGIALAAGFFAAGAIDPAPLPGPTAGDATARASAQPSPSRGIAAEPSRSSNPDPGKVAVLVGAGDIADCDGTEDDVTADLVEGIPGTVFTVGDNANPGTAENFRNCYGPTWGRPSIKDRTRPAAGDEDYDAADAAPYYAYFGDAAGKAGAGYYAYDAGTWRIYVLNTNCGNVGGCREGSAQAAWLAQDLAADPRRCVLAIFHHPYFTSGPSGGGSPERRDLWRILESAGAELVLSGHDHHYERFVPQTIDGTADPDGMVQFIIGTGGSRPDVVDVVAPNSEVHATGVFGALRLELRPDGYSFEFIGVAGPHFGDSGSGACR